MRHECFTQRKGTTFSGGTFLPTAVSVNANGQTSRHGFCGHFGLLSLICFQNSPCNIGMEKKKKKKVEDTVILVKHSIRMCCMKLTISADIILMTFRQNLTPNKTVFDQSCDINYSITW